MAKRTTPRTTPEDILEAVQQIFKGYNHEPLSPERAADLLNSLKTNARLRKKYLADTRVKVFVAKIRIERILNAH